jgi:tetratricopeptide (TPR) repeat protein
VAQVKHNQPSPRASAPALARPSWGDRLADDRRWWIAAVAILLLTAIVHWPGVWGMYIWDDNEWLQENEAVTRWNGLVDLWTPGKTPHFFPLVTSSYWLEHKLWGFGPVDALGVQRPVGYHVVNLLLHAAAAALLFRVVDKMKLPGGRLAAWLAGAVFAIHPVNVESVAWVAERKNVLCGAFFFASAYFAFRLFDLYGDAGPPPRRRRADYVFALGLFLAAMLSKTTACFLPPALLVLVWWKRGRVTRAELLRSVPFFVIAVGLGALSTYLEAHVAGTQGQPWEFSPLQRVLIATNAFWFYLWKLVWPYPVIQIYPRFPIDAGKPVTATWLYLAPAAAAALVAALVAFRRRLGRAPLAVTLVFAGGLFPALGFISFYTMIFTFVADHYQYLACPVVIVFAAELLVLAARWLAGRVEAAGGRDARRTGRLVVGAVCGGVLAALGLLSNGVSALYQNNADLWGFAYTYNPNSYFVANQLAIALLANSQPPYDLVTALAKRAITLKPDDWRAYDVLRKMYDRTGDLDMAALMLREVETRMSPVEMKRRAESMERIARMAEGDVPRSPEFRQARAAEANEQWDRAIALYQDAIRLHPAEDDAYLRLGHLLQAGRNDPAAAEKLYRQVLARNPGSPDAWLYLGYALRALGREQDATEALQKAQQLGGIAVLQRHPEFLQPRKEPAP